MNALGSQRPLGRATLVNGAPRHFQAKCSAECGYSGTRTADRREDIPLGRRCPRCGATVEAVGS
jgi:hypothetical protein